MVKYGHVADVTIAVRYGKPPKCLQRKGLGHFGQVAE